MTPKTKPCPKEICNPQKRTCVSSNIRPFSSRCYNSVAKCLSATSELKYKPTDRDKLLAGHGNERQMQHSHLSNTCIVLFADGRKHHNKMDSSHDIIHSPIVSFLEVLTSRELYHPLKPPLASR